MSSIVGLGWFSIGRELLIGNNINLELDTATPPLVSGRLIASGPLISTSYIPWHVDCSSQLPSHRYEPVKHCKGPGVNLKPYKVFFLKALPC